jgi:hypothetical protein
MLDDRSRPPSRPGHGRRSRVSIRWFEVVSLAYETDLLLPDKRLLLAGMARSLRRTLGAEDGYQLQVVDNWWERANSERPPWSG